MPTPGANDKTKVFADIDDREIIHYLSGDAANAEALIEKMAKEIQGRLSSASQEK